VKKIGLIIVASVLALSALGIGYATWSKSLSVNANAQTGHLEAIFDSASVGTMSSGVICSESIGSQSGHTINDLLNFAIGNLYPGASATVEFTVKNSGTIPITTDVGAVLGSRIGWPTPISGYVSVEVTDLSGGVWDNTAVINANGTISGKITVTMLSSAPIAASGHSNTTTDYLPVVGYVTATQAN
jgi:hypothetical protein